MKDSFALTSREKEVLKMLAAGQSEKDVAVNLSLSIKTVQGHKFNLMRKLRVHSTADLLAAANRLDIG